MPRRLEAGQWSATGCVAVAVLLALTACAPTTASGAATPRETTATGSSGTQRDGSSESGGIDPECTKATKVTIVGKASTEPYAFSPRKLTVRRGGFLAVTNKSDEVHALATTPDAGIVTSVLDVKERQVIQFPKTGTFTVQSADGAALRVTVAGESGCGTPKPTLTFTGNSTVAPAKLSLIATENFTVVNESGTAQTVMCTPDPGGNGDNSRLDAGETQLLAIDKPGRYTCASVQHPRAKATITVHEG
ncbi:hypothetical protein [Krasilnikovia sp. MM14-A1259]|uniref:cupredoxin domain-containing protein n=1 Tax=Krasilnikovia sp. MM14-A1259 TaxID=3373539 RepID=UPI0038141DA1